MTKNFRLGGMMFLQYAIWGAWLPLLWDLLMEAKGFSGDQVGNVFAIGAVGAIFGPFIAGQVAAFSDATWLGVGIERTGLVPGRVIILH